MGIPFALASRTEGGGFFLVSGGRVVMEGQRRIKGAGSCQGKRDGTGKTGTDLNGRHLLGYAGRGVVEGRDEGEEEVVLLRTALNGRPRAGVDWGKNGVEGWGGRDLAHQTALNGRPSAREVVESA